MKCPGLHCDGCGDGSGRVVAAVTSLAVTGAVVWLVITYMWVVAAVLGVAVVAAVAGGVWLARHGAEVATVSRSALPPPEATPISTRPAQALPVQEYHLHLHGPLTREQLAEVAAIQQAGYRAFDTYRRQP